jgi:hypothetical protein
LLEKVTLRGATDSGSAAVALRGAGVPGTFVMREVVFGSNDILVYNGPTSGLSFLSIISPRVNGSFSEGFIATGAGLSTIFLTGLGALVTSAVGDFCRADTPTATLLLVNVAATIAAGSVDTGVRVLNGGEVQAQGISFPTAAKGIVAENTGAAPIVRCATITTFGAIEIDHPGTTGFITGAFDREVVTVDPASSIGLQHSQTTVKGFTVVGELFQADRQDRAMNLSKLVREASTLGLTSGGELTPGAGLTLNIAAGSGFLSDPTDDFIKEVSWSGGTLAMTDDSENFVWVDTNGVFQRAASRPNVQETIFLGRAPALGGSIDFIDQSPQTNKQHGDLIEEFLRVIFGSRYETGSIVTENGVRGLDVTAGNYFLASLEFNPMGGTGITWDAYRSDGSGGHIKASQTTVDNANWDDGTGTLNGLTAGTFAKHSLYVVGDGSLEEYLLVYGQEEFATLGDAQSGALPVPPPTFIGGVTLIAAIIVEEGQANIEEIVDSRPFGQALNVGGGAVTNHGDLVGLLDDDHPQYLLIGGSRAMTGNLNMGSNNITNVGTINGITIETHAARHLPNGADALATATPVTIVDTTNAPGTANSFARSDHVHGHGTRGGGTQHAAATQSVNGFMSSADKTKLDGLPSIVRYALKIIDVLIDVANAGVAAFSDWNWFQTRNSGFTSGTVIYDVTPGTNRDLTMEIFNLTTATILGTTTVVQGGIRQFGTFAFTVPTADASLQFRAFKVGGGGGNPSIHSIIVEYDQ